MTPNTSERSPKQTIQSRLELPLLHLLLVVHTKGEPLRSRGELGLHFYHAELRSRRVHLYSFLSQAARLITLLFGWHF